MKLSVVRCPFPLNNAEYRDRYPHTNIGALSKYAIEYIPTEYFDELLGYNNNPSTGLAFLFWLHKLRGPLNANTIFAFSFFDKCGPHHYFESTGDTTHDGELEKRLFWNLTNPKMLSGIEK